MEGLIVDVGKYKKQGVAIMKGSQVEHYATPYENLPSLMKVLFN